MTFTKERLTELSRRENVGAILGEEIAELARIALASLEAEPAIHRWRRVTVEPYGPYPWHYGNFIGFSKPVEGIEDEYFYSAPSAPVVPQEATPEDIAILASTFAPRGVTYQWDSDECNAAADSWNACRAAMLQSFGNSEQLNSPVIPDGWVLVPEEPTHEMLEAGDEQFGTYDVYRRMIAASPQQEVMP